MPLPVKSIEDQSFENIDLQALESHVRALSETYVPRTCTQAEKLKNAASYIRDQLLIWNSDTSFQTYTFDNSEYSNIVSEFGPDTEEVIVVGAHYDAFMALPGADDNASGVAGLLEMARLLSSKKLNRRVLLVAYACEEPPHFAGPGMGSFVHADSLQNHKILLMISLEMIGYFSNRDGSQQFPIPALGFLYPEQGNYIAVVGELFSLHAAKLKANINKVTELDAYSINAPASVPGVDFSDHRNYWQKNYSAVMVSDTAFYRNANYHTSADTFDTLNYEKMAQVVYGVYTYVVNLAE